VVTSVMNLIARVQMTTSAAHLVIAFMPVFAATTNLIVRMQAMKCIVRVSIVCFLVMSFRNVLQHEWGRTGTRLGYWWESQRERDH
jgi:hypothetical protein